MLVKGGLLGLGTKSQDIASSFNCRDFSYLREHCFVSRMNSMYVLARSESLMHT